ncbi:TrmH family RNA methyltransferase [Populibacterium corticicola]|uniref:TrmH family RNA methyltransferase n=1 Tax=Populibacterium corticicola TaxID=1812826 RepID=A0ABW5XE09_9MICO
MLIEITDLSDDRLTDYTNLTDVKLRSKSEPEKGLYIAESAIVLRRAIAAGHTPRSLLVSHKWVESLSDVIEQFPDVPVFAGTDALLEELTGFNVHRGSLASMHRPPLPDARELLASLRDGQGARRVAIFDGVVDHTNIGAAFRGAAGLGVDAVLITPTSADPLYRRAVRVSMGTVFQVPWTRIGNLPEALGPLHDAGYVSGALALSDNAITLDDFVAEEHEKMAVIFGNEGHGLSERAIKAAQRVVKIPMAGGVDSLNVAAASAVVFYATRM